MHPAARALCASRNAVLAALLVLGVGACRPSAPPTAAAPGNAAAEGSAAPAPQTAAAAVAAAAAERRLDLDTLLRHVPADADALIVADVGAISAAATAVATRFLGAPVAPETVDAAVARLLEEARVPREIATRIVASRAGILVGGIWTADESALLVGPAEALRDGPGPGGDLQTLGLPHVQVANRDGVLLIGAGTAFTRALSRDLTSPAYDPAEVWADGWNAMPEGALLRVFLPSVESLPQDARDDIGDLGLGAVRRGAFGMSLDGTTVLLVDAETDEPLRRPFALAWRAVQQGLAQGRMLAPAPAQPWLAYAELVARGFFSHVTIDRVGTLTTLRIRPAACSPSPLLPFALLTAAVAAADSASADDSPPWSNLEAPLSATCAPVEGPGARAPLSLARLAPAELPANGAFVAFDLAGLAREELPSLFGLLPYSIEPAALTAALPASALGLAAWDTADGSGALFTDSDAASGLGDFAAVLPAAMATLLPAQLPPGITRTERPGIGLTFASGASAARLDAAAAAGDLPRLLGMLPQDVSIAYATGAALARDAGAGVPAGVGSAFFDGARLFVVGMHGLRVSRVLALVDGEAGARADRMRAESEAAVRRALAASADEDFNAAVVAAWSNAVRFGAAAPDVVAIDVHYPPEVANIDIAGVVGVTLAVADAWEAYRDAATGPPEAVPEDAPAVPAPDPLAPPAAGGKP